MKNYRTRRSRRRNEDRLLHFRGLVTDDADAADERLELDARRVVAHDDLVVEHIDLGLLHAVGGDERALDAVLARRAIDLGLQFENGLDDCALGFIRRERTCLEDDDSQSHAKPRGR